MTRIVLFVAAMALALQVGAAPPADETFLVVLKKGQQLTPADEQSLGGTVQLRGEHVWLVTIPEPAVEAWTKHKTVKYLQRVVTSDTPRKTGNTLSSMSVGEPQATGSGTPVTWRSGQYTYDGAGNITSIGTSSSPATDQSTRAYAYDSVSRLVQENVTIGPETRTTTYGYDAFGNINSVQSPDRYTPVVAVDSLRNRLTSTVANYDVAANMSRDKTTNRDYFYDPANELKETWYGSGGDDMYIYSASDERIGTRNNGSGRWRWTIRDEDGKVLREYQSDDVGMGGSNWRPRPWLWLEDYAQGAGQLIASQRVAEEGGQHHFHVDHLGTPRLVTGADGDIISQHDYAPFGLERTSLIQETNRGFDREEPYHFTGHERDFISGNYSENTDYLDYMHARTYSPVMGRFFSVDPVIPIEAAIKSPQMWNRYAYVRNNAINATDPDGRCEICLDNALGREQLAVVNGQMTMDQYLDIQAARFNGAMTGYTIVEGALTVRVAARSLLSLFTRGAAETLFENAAKGEVLQALREGAGTMSSEQRATVIRQVQRATTKESVSVVQNSNGTIQVLRSRPGRDGAQTFVTTVLKDGTEKTVQTAVNAAGQTTHYDPKNVKTVWDTLKSWWYR